MARTALVADVLSDDMIRAGERVLRALDDAKWPAAAALWLRDADSETWKLVIATRATQASFSPRTAYRKIQKLLDALPAEEPGVSLDDTSVTTTSEPLLMALHGAFQVPLTERGLRVRKTVVLGHVVDDAYIYRLG